MGVRFLLGRALCALPALLGALGTASPAWAGGLPVPVFSEAFSVEQALGPPGLSAGIVNPRFSQVVFDGALYWVLYQSGIEPLPNGNALLAVRVDEDGTVLDPQGLFVAPYADAPFHAITPAPWGALVTYSSADGDVLVRLGRDGAINSAPIAIGVGAHPYPYPGVACLSSGCLAIWSTQDETHAVALDGCGAVLPPTEIRLPYGDWEPRAAGDSYLLVGGTTSSSSTLSLQALGLAADGRTRWGPVTLPVPTTAWHAFAAGPSGALFVWLETNGTLSSLALDSSGAQRGPPQRIPLTSVTNIGGLSAEGDHFRLALHLAAADALLRLDAAGLPLDSEPLSVATDGACTASPAAVASGTRSALVTWVRDQSAAGCVETPPSAAIVDFGSNPTVTQVDVTGAKARMGTPALASDGKHYLAAWFEERAGATGLYTQALDLAGIPIESPVLTIPAPLSHNDLRPAFASFLSDRYVVELGKNSDTADSNRAAEIDAETLVRGAPREQAKLGVPGRTNFLDVEVDITRSGEDEATLTRVRAQATDRTSALIGEAWTRDLPDGYSESYPVAAFDGNNFTMIWRYEDVDGIGSEPELLLMRFDETGAPLLSDPVVLPGLGAFTPRALTYGAASFLLTLAADAPALGTPLSVIGVTPSGTLSEAEPHPLSIPGLDEQLQFTGATFDGAAFEVAWSQRSFASSNGAPLSARTDLDLHVAWVALDDSNIAEAAVANRREDEQGGALASAGDRHALLGYNRFDRDPQYLSTRAFVRELGGGACSTDRACTDATCSDCCPAACTSAAATLTCSVAACAATCAAQEHCVTGLGCVPNGRTTPKPELAKGCGCHYSTQNSASYAAVLLAGLVLVGLRRQRRHGQR